MSLGLSAVMGVTLLSEKLREKTFLLLWVLLGTCVYFLSVILVIEKVLFSLIITALILGAFIGVGIPVCLAFFADYAGIKNRGLIGAAIFFITQLLTVLIYTSISNLNIGEKFLVAGIWRSLGVVGIFFYVPIRTLHKEQRQQSFSSIFGERTFIFYFFPWFLFCLINFVEAPLLERFFGPELFNVYLMIGIGISSVSAFLGGVICDFKGRKIASMAGFVLLGISYAVLSIFQGVHLSTYSFMLLEGTAWGILYVAFIFVIWGDLSEKGAREKYYLLGNMPYLFSGWIEVLAKPFVEVIPIYASFSLASFFLFLAVLPLLYVSETLPEKAIRERELRNYIEKAKRVREKFTKG
jgi:MFS family permease